MKSLRYFVVVLLSFSAEPITYGQAGFPALNSFYATGRDSINEQALNINFSIPIRDKGEINLPIHYSLVWNSTMYYIPALIPPDYSQEWRMVNNAGWNSDGTQTVGELSSSYSYSGNCLTYWFAFSDLHGTGHQFSPLTIGLTSYGCATSGSPGTSDGSGFVLSLTYVPGRPEAPTVNSLKDKDGNSIVVPLNDSSGWASASITDPNGNAVTVDYSRG